MTVRSEKKAAMQRILDKAGFKTFRLYQTGDKLYAMLIIAFNRMCPGNPLKAYWTMINHLQNIRRGRIIDSTKWKRFELDDTETEALTQMISDSCTDIRLNGVCPLCGGPLHDALNTDKVTAITTVNED